MLVTQSEEKLKLPLNNILINKKNTPSEVRARNHLHRRVRPIQVFSDLMLTSPPMANCKLKVDEISTMPKTSKDINGNSLIYSRKSMESKDILNENSKISTKKLVDDASELEDSQRVQKKESFPVSPEEALSKYQNILYRFEQNEICRYKKIYFIRRKKEGILPEITNKEGHYIGNPGDHISYRYEVLETIDFGSFGSVFRCLDHKTRQEVAVKALKTAHHSKKQGQFEYKIVKLLNQNTQESNCIIKIKRKLEFRFHFFLVFELLDLNLCSFMSLNNFKPISASLTKRITVQLLRALCHMHGLHIIHCDLKPENILFKSSNKSSIKVIDFGSSCFNNNKVFSYIQSRFYRAPEIVFQCGYDESIDLWSLGCIVVELLTGDILFNGKNEKELVKAIVQVIGMPPKEFLDKAKAKNIMAGIEFNPESRPLHRILARYNAEIVEFVEKCLKWMPGKRITAKMGLKEKWIQGGLERKINKLIIK